MIFTILYFAFLLSFIRFLNFKKKSFLYQFFYSTVFFILFNSFFFFINYDSFIGYFLFNLFVYIVIFFYYAGLKKSISVKMIYDLYYKNYSFDNYYKKFKIESFENRIQSLISSKFLLKKKPNFYFFSKKIIKIKKYLIFIQNIFGVKDSG